jgi:hypothetical protein
MKTYVVSYDPIGPGAKHDGLVSLLSSYPRSIQALTSTWFVQTDDTAFRIAAALEEVLDDDDGMIINTLDTDDVSVWAASLSPEIDTWLQQNL